MSATLSRDLRGGVASRFANRLAPIRAIPVLASAVAVVPEEICATFFSRCEPAPLAPISRRARRRENAVKGGCARVCMIFESAQKCRFGGRFYDLTVIDRARVAA